LDHLISDYGYWVSAYGYWAVLVGTLAEGETIVVLAGYAAHQGYLGLPGVILAAFAGSFFCDQAIFHIGRRYGTALLDRRPGWRQPAERAFGLLRRHQNVFIIGFRFLYGLRTASPFAIGMSGISPWRFLFLNALAALIWAGAIGTAGYLFGHAVQAVLGHVAHLEGYAFAAIAAGGFAVWIAMIIRQRLRRRAPRGEI
jgi:membrane protein DedA with SNARE-associated domain